MTTLDELKAMYAVMTPGPWHWCDHIAPYISLYVKPGSSVIRLTEPFYRDGKGDAVSNATGIATIHNAFPALVERIETMRAALKSITLVAANQPDENLMDATGPRDAAQRGIMVCNARDIARDALALADKPLTTKGA